MTWTVRGTLDGQAYTYVEDPSLPPETRLSGRWAGTTPAVLAHLLCQQGREYPVTPTGPARTLDLADSGSVLVALAVDTTVETVEGEPPEVDVSLPEGLVIA